MLSRPTKKWRQSAARQKPPQGDFANRWCSFNGRQVKAALGRCTPKASEGDFVSGWRRGGCQNRAVVSQPAPPSREKQP